MKPDIEIKVIGSRHEIKAGEYTAVVSVSKTSYEVQFYSTFTAEMAAIPSEVMEVMQIAISGVVNNAINAYRKDL